MLDNITFDDEKPDSGHKKRKYERYLVHWKIAVVFDSAIEGRERFYGKTDDISMSGISLYSDHNIFVEAPVTVLVSIPGYHNDGRNKVVEIRCQMVYTYLCSKGNGFRTGLRLIKFKDEGKKIMRAALDAKIPAGDTNVRD